MVVVTVAVAEQFLGGPDVVTALEEWVAKEWRKVWQVTRSSIRAAAAARVTARCTFVS